MALHGCARPRPTGGGSGHNHQIPCTPGDKGGYRPGSFIEAREKVASGSHFTTRRQGEEAGGKRSAMRAMKEGGPPDRNLRSRSQGFADDKSSHAVADQVEGGVCAQQLVPEFRTGGFDRGAAGVVVVPDSAGADGIFYARPQVLPSRMPAPKPVQNIGHSLIVQEIPAGHKKEPRLYPGSGDNSPRTVEYGEERERAVGIGTNLCGLFFPPPCSPVLRGSIAFFGIGEGPFPFIPKADFSMSSPFRTAAGGSCPAKGSSGSFYIPVVLFFLKDRHHLSCLTRLWFPILLLMQIPPVDLGCSHPLLREHDVSLTARIRANNPYGNVCQQ